MVFASRGEIGAARLTVPISRFRTSIFLIIQFLLVVACRPLCFRPGKEGLRGSSRSPQSLESGEAMAIDFTVKDAAGEGWTLSEHLDAAAVLVFLRGDF